MGTDALSIFISVSLSWGPGGHSSPRGSVVTACEVHVVLRQWVSPPASVSARGVRIDGGVGPGAVCERGCGVGGAGDWAGAVVSVQSLS